MVGVEVEKGMGTKALRTMAWELKGRGKRERNGKARSSPNGDGDVGG